MISTLITTERFTGNGSNAIAYVLPFKVLAAEHVKVKVRTIATGEILELEIGPDYTVTGAGGASCSFTTAAAWGGSYELIVSVEMPIIQDSNLINHGRFDAEVIEGRFDYLTLLVQILHDSDLQGIARFLKVPDGEVVDDLPSAADRADKTLAFDSSGNPIAGPATSSAAADAAASAASAAESAADAEAAAASVSDEGLAAAAALRDEMAVIYAATIAAQPITGRPVGISAP